MPIMGRGGAFTRADVSERGALTNDFYAPYRSASRYVREDCELRQFETYDEQVTFHNIAVQYDTDEYRWNHEKVYYLAVPQSLTFTTPSGITVTLPIQGKRLRPVLFSGALNFFVTIRPKVHQNDAAYSLPTSPLTRMFGKPVKINLAFPPPTYTESWSYEQNGLPASYAMSLPLNPAWHPAPMGIPNIPLHRDLPPVLKDFTVIIHQRVDLQAIPMTFTVPVSDAPPPDVH